jgi:pSer/pThr/pTyr-binding forkhead associated (FHA) protein
VDGTNELEDLGPLKGTYVNGQPARVEALADGDKIRFGGNLFLFVRGAR